MGAKPRAVLATQGRQRNGEQKTLPDHGEKIDLVVLNLIRIGVVGPLLVHLVKINTHAFNERRKASPTHASPRGAGGSGNMNTCRERFKMNRDIYWRVNYPRVIKFEIKNRNCNLDVFRRSGATQ